MNNRERRIARKTLKKQGIDQDVADVLLRLLRDEQLTGEPVLAQTDQKCQVQNLFDNQKKNDNLVVKV